MKKLNNIIIGFGLSTLFLILGIYILYTVDTIWGKIIGILSIGFWGALIIWAIFKIYKNNQASTE